MLTITREASVGREFELRGGTRVRVTGMSRLALRFGAEQPQVGVAYLSGPYAGKTGDFPWSQFRRSAQEVA